MTPLLTVELRYEHGVVTARQRARQIARLLGFDAQDQTRITTAVSEIARNAYQYAGGGRLEFSFQAGPPAALVIRVQDKGPGIPDLQAILDGQYTSRTGMGLGLVGARHLTDRFRIESENGVGTTVILEKDLPRRRPGAPPSPDLAQIADELARNSPQSPFEEMQVQNQELLRALQEIQVRQGELDQLNRELADTNRGVMALYAELDDKAHQLEQASELKTRFLSSISHELRTPLSSIRGLARLLLERTDGDLTPEQEKQVGFIRKSADSLVELVNDLLDTARIEAGKVTIFVDTFEVADLFSSLRGVFRPLINSSNVTLCFEVPEGLPPLSTDEGKVAQILRNFISNALKFTEHGTIVVSATPGSDDTVHFVVRDQGIGIASDDQKRIFEDFGQIDGAVQRRVKGTGLGLPLSRKLAEILGGTVSVDSTPGVGSTFVAIIPAHYVGSAEVVIEGAGVGKAGPNYA